MIDKSSERWRRYTEALYWIGRKRDNPGWWWDARKAEIKKKRGYLGLNKLLSDIERVEQNGKT